MKPWPPGASRWNNYHAHSEYGPAADSLCVGRKSLGRRVIILNGG